MKKIVFSSILLFSTNILATEIEDPQRLDNNDKPSHQMDCDIIEVPACVEPAPHEGIYESSPNGLPTKLIMHNKGAYNVRYRVAYYEGSGGPMKEFKSSSLALGSTYTVTIPAKAYYAYIDAEYHSGFGWSKLYRSGVCTFNNKWTSYDDTMNVFQINNWGATINLQWKPVQPKDTYFNGASDALRCAASK